MQKTKLLIYMKSFMLLTFLALCSNAVFAQTLTTDQPDYSPGSIVTITGSGFGVNENVTMQVLHYPTCCNDATSPDHQQWTAF